jgi:acyl-CoA dehydrogenase family protein 9
MNRAARLARANARRIRFMILIGFLFYGKAIAQREFFLRRITTLSLYLYGIIAVLAKLDAARKTGRALSTDLEALDYFAEEARRVSKHNRRIFSSKQERLHHKIVARIIA